MAYLALYREWRPRTFRTIVGQDHVTKTLLNALKNGKIVHAYLFSGPRGTGKTTAAKILAKSLNCEHPADYEPCNKCNSCLNIDRGTALEVLEIDAASNRGIDEIRDLRDKVRLSVPQGKYKVYIIDEVHMLTTEAFNALLKIMEEPPANVVFILATTEVHKIPPTILSRVQRFEFHRIPTELIHNRLKEICLSLGRNVDELALKVIAQKSEGGLRDALSILDQCLIMDDPIGVDQVYQILGMVGEEFSAQLVKDMLEGDFGKALADLGQGIQQGKDPRQIIRELLDYLRQALYYCSTGQDPLVSPHLIDELKNQSKRAGLSRILGWINVLLEGEGNLKYATNARLAAELLLVKAMYEAQGQMKPGLQEGIITASTGSYDSGRPELPNKEKSSASGYKPKDEFNDTVSYKSELKAERSQLDPLSQPSSIENNSGISLEKIIAHWSEVQEGVRKRKKSTHAFMIEGSPCHIDNNTLYLAFREGYSFHKDKMNQPENRQTLEEVMESIFGTKLGIKSIMESEVPSLTNNGQESRQEIETVIKKAEDFFGPDMVVVNDNTK